MMEKTIQIDEQTGDLLEEYQSEGALRDSLVGLFLLGLGLATLIGGLFIPFFFFAPFFFFLAGGTLLYLARRTRGLRLLVCRNVLLRVQGGRTEVLPWEEVLEVRRAQAWELAGGLPIPGAAPPLTIVRLDGRKWAFHQTLPSFPYFVEDVEQRSLPHLLDAALQILAEGKRVKFGTLEVSAKGLHVRGIPLRWKYIDCIEWEGATLLIWEQGEGRPFVRRTISLLPNYHLLLALCSHHRAF